MHLLKKVGIAAATLAAAASVVTLANPAFADTAARQGDVVGVGSDTAQYAADFAFDGAPGVAGGYNNIGNINRVFNVFATGDANGRTVYDGTCGAADATGTGQLCANTTNQAPNLLGGSVTLRAGTRPVLRPNGSGQGIGALVSDATSNYGNLPQYSIQFARASRLPNATEEGNCPTSNAACGGLHVYRIANDTLAIAHATSGFNGPATLTVNDLVKIYQCTATKWTDVGGTSSATIHPLIPQSGSGTRNFFLSDLQAANGGTAITLGSCVRTVQEHDPSGIYQDSSVGDAIEPFSQARLNLINAGYYVNGVNYSGTGAPNGAFTPNFLTTETGAGSYSSTRGIYLVVRQVDVTSTTPFQPGAAANYTQALITNSQSAVRSASAQSEISAAGFTPSYFDCGINPTSC